jgi:SAM-dependent methyltransferase
VSAAALDPRRRFDAAAENYDRYRPSYPPALVDWIIATTGVPPRARVADIGCGTGIATRLFAARGFEAVGIDPSEEMLAFARRAGRGRYVRAQAEATSLAGACVDLVVAAQCFHWFDLLPTLAELRRILKPGGWCAAFWNLRAATPLSDAYDALLRTSTTQYEVMTRQEAAPALLRAALGKVRCREAEFEHAQSLDRDGLHGRAYSSSCVAHGVRSPEAFDFGLAELFDRYARAGRVEIRYRTVGLCWRPL